jgi:hypothetical protein
MDVGFQMGLFSSGFRRRYIHSDQPTLSQENEMKVESLRGDVGLR